jgi:branched-chain amino acid transport system substrate-binding protein
MRMKTLLIIAVVVLLFPITFSACHNTSGNPTQKEITIGFLVARTGEWAAAAETYEATLDIASADINSFLVAIKYQGKLNIVAENTQTDPAVALEKLKLLQSRGIRFVIGPPSSAEFAAIADYASQSGILVVSYASTAPSLAERSGNVYRFALNDTYEAQRLARLINEDGIKAIVPLTRGDVWGDDYIKALSESYQALSGVVIQGVRYSPNTSDFSGILTELNTKVSQAITTYGQGKVAVFLAALDETSVIFSQAALMGSTLQSVGWYGTDGSALNSGILNDAQAGQFAAATKFRCLQFAAGDYEATRKLAAQVKTITGRDLDGYAAAAYDAAWLITLSHLVAGDAAGDIEALRAAFMGLTETYQGLTGETSLDSNGDREYGRYQLWAVGLDGSTASWQKTDQFLLTPSGWWPD